MCDVFVYVVCAKGAKLLAEVLHRSGTGGVSSTSTAEEACSSGRIRKFKNSAEPVNRSNLDLIRDLLGEDGEGCSEGSDKEASVVPGGMRDGNSSESDVTQKSSNSPTADGGDSKRRKML